MADERTPSAEAHELWRITNEMAMALVDEDLGPPSDWAASALMSYRLQAEFQADWKAEVGHWLHAAKSNGFLEKMLKPLLGERDRKARNENRDGNDPRHLKLYQHLGAAMVCHYFTGLGWSCIGFDTETGGSVDIDLALSTPDKTLVEFQVKVCDQPGRLENGRYVEGDYDERVLQALDNAVGQLPQPARSVAMVALFAQRSFSLAGDPSCVVERVFGSSTQLGTDVFIRQTDLGRFLTGDWKQIAGVVILDLSRTADFDLSGDEVRVINMTTYPCTVLLNPRAEHLANPDWFPRARVAVFEGESFRWLRSEPWIRHGLPTGTRVVP
ncbi:MAG TPA: hypothetical protein VK745_02635 [Polyangiaceae bacterium]|jgi:hypothetical protein|nr:hypothetical protein [Polyangiaceae bacterium]